MYRYGIFYVLFAALLSSCGQKSDLPAPDEPYVFLKSRLTRDNLPAPDQRSSSGNPYSRYGRLHNEGFRDMVLGTNTSGNLKQWAISLGEYTGTEGISAYKQASALNQLSIAEAVDSARRAGVDELSIATWQVLAEQLLALDNPEPSDVLLYLDAMDAGIADYAPDEGSAAKERAFGTSAVFRYSLALHTGQEFDGVNYGSQIWNPTPHVPPHPETGITINWIRLIIQDAIGFMMGFDWVQAIVSSLTDLMDQLGGVGYDIGEVFGGIAAPTVPFEPDSGTSVLPDN